MVRPVSMRAGVWAGFDARAVAGLGALTLVYLLLGRAGLLFVGSHEAPHVLLLAAPLAFLVVARGGRAGLISVAVAGTCGFALAFLSAQAPVMGIVGGAVACGLAGALAASLLVRLFGDHLGGVHLEVAADAVRFVAASLVASLIPAGVGAAALVLAGLSEPGQLLPMAVSAWLAATTALVTLAPIGVAWLARDTDVISRIGVQERIGVTAILIVASIAVFHRLPGFSWAYGNTWLAIPAVGWLAVRGSRLELASALALVTCVAIAGRSPHAAVSAPTLSAQAVGGGFAVQAFLAVLAVASLAINLALREVRESNERLRRSHAALDARVDARTAELRRENRRLARRLEAGQQQAARAAEAALAFDHASHPIVITDEFGALLRSNPALDGLLGHGVTRCPDHISDIIVGGPRGSPMQQLDASQREAWRGPVDLRRRDGSALPLWLTLDRVPSDVASASRFIWSLNERPPAASPSDVLARVADNAALARVHTERVLSP